MDKNEENSYWDLRSRDIFAGGLCGAALFLAYFSGWYFIGIIAVMVYLPYYCYLVFVQLRQAALGSVKKEIAIILLFSLALIFWWFVRKHLLV
jgi:hypothetical protein